MEDFFLYQTQEDQNIPMSVYGSAAMKLIEMREFPLWALCFYSDLKKASSGSPPDVLAYKHKNAIILAPSVEDKLVKGMLICEDVVSEKEITMETIDGAKIKVQMPKLNIRYSAQENIELPILGEL